MRAKLGLSQDKISEARQLATRICEPVSKFVDGHTSVTVERATLRLAGADDADADGVPVPNLIVDQARDRLADGAFRLYASALARTGDSPERLNRKIAEGLRLTDLPPADESATARKAVELVNRAETRVRANREYRESKQAEWKDRNHRPLLYLIVATGNIYEDVKQATAAAEQGADVIAVIQTTAQSLLDYVPFGPTTEGFGGTYAT
ncbi:MAG TPA: lysine 5,6-aminomutase subunit alpha, partial [Spirochaetia bacterium]|nr:lysine 5,6-aminomutase subunit alpha [Spirochaetia bacterium]